MRAADRCRGACVTVRLVGGLGNQLFGYFAGAALAAHLGVCLRLDLSWTRHGMSDHGLLIEEFELPGKWDRSRFLDGIFGAPGVLGRSAQRIATSMDQRFRAERIYASPVVGYDPSVWNLKPGTELRGYFQSWRYPDIAVGSGLPRRPQIRVASRQLQTHRLRAQVLRPISVHVRRGDYSRVPEYGLLGRRYYVRAIERLRDLGHRGPVWIFSDDHTAAQRLIPGESISLGPSEDMLCMSHAAANVIANSTFSWWGAWMNEGSPDVIAPDPWFQEMPAIDDLIPPHWMVMEADFG